jgi:hypothetical protein
MLAVGMPTLVWGIFFSPFGDRIVVTMVVVYLLMAKAIGLNRVQLPFEMMMEIEKVDRGGKLE